LLTLNAWHTNDEQGTLHWGRCSTKTIQSCTVDGLFGPKNQQKQPKTRAR
jgi:hypothetical protein